MVKVLVDKLGINREEITKEQLKYALEQLGLANLNYDSSYLEALLVDDTKPYYKYSDYKTVFKFELDEVEYDLKMYTLVNVYDKTKVTYKYKIDNYWDLYEFIFKKVGE